MADRLIDGVTPVGSLGYGGERVAPADLARLLVRYAGVSDPSADPRGSEAIKLGVRQRQGRG